MTTAELNPAYVPNSSQPQPPELEKTQVAPTPPTAEALLVEEEFRDSLVNLTHDTVGLHESREDDHNGPLVGAHRVDNGHSYPSTRQQPEKLRVGDGSSSATLDALIYVPGFPRPFAPSVPPTADEELPQVAEGKDKATTASQLPEHPATPPAEPIPDVFSLSSLDARWHCAAGIRFRPYAATGTQASGGITTDAVEPAVVPKFYAYYAAVGADGSLVELSHASHTKCGPLEAASAVRWPTRIILVEECGQSILPLVFTQEQKSQCLQLVNGQAPARRGLCAELDEPPQRPRAAGPAACAAWRALVYDSQLQDR